MSGRLAASKPPKPELKMIAKAWPRSTWQPLLDAPRSAGRCQYKAYILCLATPRGLCYPCPPEAGHRPSSILFAPNVSAPLLTRHTVDFVVRQASASWRHGRPRSGSAEIERDARFRLSTSIQQGAPQVAGEAAHSPARERRHGSPTPFPAGKKRGARRPKPGYPQGFPEPAGPRRPLCG
jgi:hypothetical protein